MKTFLFAAALTVLSAGAASARGYSACINNNSKACRDARAAFAEHHNGQFPEQYYNSWYGGRQGRWNQRNNQWRWEGIDGDNYSKGRHGWQWAHPRGRRNEGGRDHDHDHDNDNH